MKPRAPRLHRLRQACRYHGAQLLNRLAVWADRTADELSEAYYRQGPRTPVIPRPPVIQVNAVGTYVRAETDAEAADLFLGSL